MLKAFAAVNAATILFSFSSHAKDICEVYRNSAPQPRWYSELCDENGTGKIGAGGAFSSLGSAFNLNPATILTNSTPVGVELLANVFPGAGLKPDVALLKGFSGYGFAISTTRENNIYSNSSALANPKSANSSTTTTFEDAPAMTSLGFSLSPLSIFRDEESSSYHFSVGALWRNSSRASGAGGGATLALGALTLSTSYVHEPMTATTYDKSIYTGTLGLKVNSFSLETIIIKSKGQKVSLLSATGTLTPLNTESPTPTVIVTSITNIGGFLVTLAYRRYEDILFQKYNEFHGHIETRLNDTFSLGYSYNYLPGAHTLGLQIIL